MENPQSGKLQRDFLVAEVHALHAVRQQPTGNVVNPVAIVPHVPLNFGTDSEGEEQTGAPGKYYPQLVILRNAVMSTPVLKGKTPESYPKVDRCRKFTDAFESTVTGFEKCYGSCTTAGEDGAKVLFDGEFKSHVKRVRKSISDIAAKRAAALGA